MPKPSAQPSVTAQLRVSAEAHLKSGTAPATHGWPAGEQALSLLHTLASEPASASDALKLLHELQVHQVELDLQQEQAHQEHQQISLAQAGYIALFELAPFGYLTVKPDGQIVEVNRMACDWLDIAHDPHKVRHVQEFLALDSRETARDALLRLTDGHASETFSVRGKAHGVPLQVRACAAPGGQLMLMAFMPVEPVSGH